MKIPNSFELMQFFQDNNYNFPNEKITIGCGFEVDGAYEDWGFVAYYDGKLLCSGRYPDVLLKRIREKLKETENGNNR